MLKSLSAKNQTLVFVSIVMFMFSAVLTGIIYLNQKDELEKLEYKYYDNIKRSYIKVLEKHTDFYKNRLKENICSLDIKLSLENSNRKKLFELSNSRWQTLLKENPYLKIMHFHKPDGTSFLRMHKPDKFGDNLSSFRPMVKQIHKEQKIIYGFERGIFNLAYRIFIPIFNNNKYIGALEFGTKPEQILHEMNYFNNIEGGLFIEKEGNEEQEKTIQISNYILQYKTLKDNKLFEQIIKNNYNFETLSEVSLDDKIYSVYSFELKDFQNKTSAKVIFFNDITDIKEGFENTIKELILLFIGLLSLVIIVINFGFKKIIETLDKSYQELNKSRKSINEYINLIDKNVITSTTDLDGNITYVSEAFCKISGYKKADLIGKNESIMKHQDIDKSIYKEIIDTLNKNNIWCGEIKNRKKDGGFYWVKATISPIYDENNIKIGYTAIREDITDKKYIEQISITDALTNIFNRRYFNTTFPKVINGAKRDNELISFVILDVDYFKQYNDTYGHQKGDEVLKAIGKTLKDNTKRESDYCFRLGGEEFGLVFKTQNKEKALKFTNKIRRVIEELKIEHSGNSASSYITASFGLICLNANDIENDDIMYKLADDKLYEAKESGRNKVLSN